MSIPAPNELAKLTRDLNALKEQLGVHAIQGCDAAGFASRKDRSVAAVMVLIEAAHAAALAYGGDLEQAFFAFCASKVPRDPVPARRLFRA